MILYLIRHGIAEDGIPSGGSDADRALTQKGTLRTAVVAKALKKLDIVFDRIISSPYVRARQTAEIIVRITDYSDEISFDKRLIPFATFEEMSDLIAENNDVESLLLAGHEPSMGECISGITSGGQLGIDVKKASVTAIQIDRFKPRVAGTLLWSIPPRIFETMMS